MTSEIKVDTISEQTSANGVTIDGLTIKDGNIQGSPALVGTTPSFTIGDGGAEDTKIVFDGNALDYYIALDDSADNLIIGSGSTVGSNSLITIDSDGDFTFDSAADITLDAAGNNIRLKYAGTQVGQFKNVSSDLEIHTTVNDKDMIFKGVDNNSEITALTLDMSAAGEATFNSRVGIKSAPDLGAGLHVKVSDSGGSVNGNYDTVVIEESGHSGIAILSGTSSAGLIGFGDSGAALRGYFAYNHSSDSIEIATAEAERMRIDGSGLIGIGNTTASSFNAGANRMVLGTGSGNNGLTIYAQNNASSSIHFADGSSGDASYRGYLQYSHSSDALILATSATEVASFHTDGIVFNEQSNDQNFRVESNNNANMLYVDAGSDFVAIGTTSSNAATLNVTASAESATTFVAENTASGSSAFDGQVIKLFAARGGNSAYGFLQAFSAAGSDVEFLLRGDGSLFGDGAYSVGADYAEYFEWKDGNSSSEDRRGYSVILDGNKIVKATDSDDVSKIIGVISANPAVVGDSAYMRWNDKYQKDDFGANLLDGDGDRILNTDYDETKDYVPREDRKEWDTVGLMGKLRLKKGQPTGTNWIKMRDISDTVEEWLVR